MKGKTGHSFFFQGKILLFLLTRQNSVATETSHMQSCIPSTWHRNSREEETSEVTDNEVLSARSGL